MKKKGRNLIEFVSIKRRGNFIDNSIIVNSTKINGLKQVEKIEQTAE